MHWLDVADTVLATTTETGASAEGVAGLAFFGIVGLIVAYVVLTGSSDETDEEGEENGRQRRGLCENCGYEWRPRKSRAERETDPQCPDCGSTRVSIHYQ